MHSYKIYQLTTPHSDLVYIDATFQPVLSRRYFTHREAYQRWKNGKAKRYLTSFPLFELGDVSISLIETCPDMTRNQAMLHVAALVHKRKQAGENVVGPKSVRWWPTVCALSTRLNDPSIRQAEKIDCTCGRKVTPGNRAAHMVTAYHKKRQQPPPVAAC